MHRIAGVDHRLDLVARAIDQGHLAGIAQRHREQVVDRDVVRLLARTILRRNQQLPAGAHLGHAELGRRGRVEQQIPGHNVDLFIGHLARGSPVRHSRWRAVIDEVVQIIKTHFAGDVGGEGLARRTLAQHAVAAGTPLEVYGVRLLVLGGRHYRIARAPPGDLDVELAQGRHAGLIRCRGFVAMLGRLILARGRLHREGQRHSRAGQQYRPID